MENDDQFEDGARKADADKDDIETDYVTDAASSSFGITYLYPWQRIVIGNILDASKAFEESRKKTEDKTDCGTENSYCNNSDCTTTQETADDTESYAEPEDLICNGKQIVLLPTGAGKSLCFLTPALLLPGPTMVLYPLLALMADQKRRMDEGNLESVIFRGGQTSEEREENFRKLKNGARIILANPEVLQNEKLVNRLAECNISHIAIDEAHCVSEWGDTFRPAYLTLGNIIKKLGVPVVTAFTATASPVVLQRISQVLFDGSAHIVRSDSDRPNIHYNVINTYAKKREAFRLAITLPKPLLVFCGTRNNSEEMARELGMYYGNDRVKFYHAGMEREEKTAVEKWFYPKKDAILCCTCAFGMGVDKKDIHTVIHWQASPTAESYIQEAGRGGRDGSVAEAYLLWSPEDSMKAEKYPEGSRERVLKTFAESKTCRREVLLEALGDHLNYCDGCDVCQRKGPAPFARDASIALKVLRKNRKYYTRETLIKTLQEKLNSAEEGKFEFNIWENTDAEEIVNLLEKKHFIRRCFWPWKGKYTDKPACKVTGKLITLLHPLYRHLLSWLHPSFHLLQVQQKQEQP